MVLFITDPSRMDEDRDHMAARILDLTLEIIYLITGEDYTVVKKSSGECVTPHVSGEWSRTPGAITEPPPHSLIHEQKILELTNRITELLSGEVPIRCQDVTVYFSMEEWEYLEGHKDLYKDVMMKDHHPLTYPDRSSKGKSPERCPSPQYSQDCLEEKQNVLLDHQESYGGTSGAEIPLSVSVHGEEQTEGSQEHIFHEVDDNQSQSGKNITEHGLGKLFACPECGKLFKDKSNLSRHKRIHINERPFTCSECGKSYTQKSNLVIHQRSHTGEKPFSCSECGKCFSQKAVLVVHQITHTGVKPNLCSECGKCFSHRSTLMKHLRMHTQERPYSCSECGNGFNAKENLMKHLKTHTGEKPNSCPECGQCFSKKSSLVTHVRTHTGEKPYSCPECGKCFIHKTGLEKHLRSHTGEKPFPCTECGKCFSYKSNLVKHLRIHTGEKPYSCLECGKCFRQSSGLVKHVKIHTE